MFEHLCFTSVQSAKWLDDMDLGFIGVVKKASRQYPMAQLQNKHFTRRGDCYGLVLVDEGLSEMIAFEWVDQQRRCFIASSVYLEEGEAVLR